MLKQHLTPQHFNDTSCFAVCESVVIPTAHLDWTGGKIYLVIIILESAGVLPPVARINLSIMRCEQDVDDLD